MQAAVEDRFLSRISETPSGCWEWVGTRLPNGYGKLKVDGRDQYTHRLSHEIFNGAIPSGFEVDHLCRNRACCNPEHLEAVTPSVNVRRQRASRPVRSHCFHGHPLDESNLRVVPTRAGGHRHLCRTCLQSYGRTARARKKGRATA